MNFKLVSRFSGTLVVMAASVFAFAVACTPTKDTTAPRLTGVPTYNLLLDESAFPPDWSRNPCEPHCDRAERPGNSLRSFGRIDTNIPGSVNQQVYLLKSEETASEWLRRTRVTTMPRGINRFPSIESLPPPQISYRSPIADEQFLACGVDKIPYCQASLRYDRYLIEFFFHLDQWLWIKGNGLKIEEVEPILRAIDEMIVAQFDLPASVLEVTVPLPTSTPFPLAPTPPSTLPEIIQTLSHDDPRARTDAAYALEPLGVEAEAAIPALIANLKYEGELRYDGLRIVSEVDVRYAAVHALGIIGPPAKGAILDLLKIVQHDPSNRWDFESLNEGDTLVPLRQATIRTLVQIGDISVVPLLMEMLDDEWALVSVGAAEAVGQLTGNDFSVDIETESYFTEDGTSRAVLKAKAWWESEGKYQDWGVP